MDTFIGKADHLQVNHKDGNKMNNKLDNLEYVTPSENLLHAHQTNLLKQYCRPVIRQNIATGEIVRYPSIKLAAENNNRSKSSIADCCHGRNKSNGKDWFYWMFESPTEQTQPCVPIAHEPILFSGEMGRETTVTQQEDNKNLLACSLIPEGI